MPLTAKPGAQTSMTTWSLAEARLRLVPQVDRSPRGLPR